MDAGRDAKDHDGVPLGDEFLRLLLAWRPPDWCPDEAPLDRAVTAVRWLHCGTDPASL
jgi:hypothetical protein